MLTNLHSLSRNAFLTLAFSVAFQSELVAQTRIDRIQEGVVFAKADINPTQLNKVKGTVYFTQTKEGVLIIAELTDLTPGEHGFHIHEFGDCSTRDASSAGNHFNPTNQKHGSPDSSNRHVGDLGNIYADGSGYAYYQRMDRIISLNGPNSIIGRSVIVHENPDDFTTQPTGNAGLRQGCGRIVEVLAQ
jgi:Cu-Zn family superoxide dismutase